MIDFLRFECPISLLYFFAVLAFVGWMALGILILATCQDIAQRTDVGCRFFPGLDYYDPSLLQKTINAVLVMWPVALWPLSAFFYFFYYLSVRLGRFVADRFYPED